MSHFTNDPDPLGHADDGLTKQEEDDYLAFQRWYEAAEAVDAASAWEAALAYARGVMGCDDAQQ